MKHMNFIAPYSHYFYKAMHLIGTPNEQSVFLCLWGRYMAIYGKEENPKIKISDSQLSCDTGCSRKTINKCLESLIHKNFIKQLSDGAYVINANRYIALNVAYNKLSNLNDKKAFCKAISKCDDNTLRQLGYTLNENCNILLSLKGGVSHFTQFESINTDETESFYSVVGEGVSKMLQLFGIEHENVATFFTPLKDDCNILPTYDWDAIVKNITESVAKRDFIKITLSHFTQFDNETVTNDSVQAENNDKTESFYSVEEEKVSKMTQLSAIDEMYRTGKLSHFTQFCLIIRFFIENCNILLSWGESNVAAYINNIYKIYPNMLPNMFNKDNNFKETCIKHERSECFNIGGEQIKTLQNDCGSENDDDWEDEDNLPADHEKNSDDDYEPEPLALDPHAFDKFNAKNELFRKRRRLQFIPPAEIEEYISNLPACLDRPDKIFINQLWEILKELAMGGYENENGEWVEVEQDPDGMQFPAERIMIDVLQPAYEATVEILERGVVEYKGEELPVETKEDFPPESVDLIVDWQTESDVTGRYYIVSILKFRNIYAPEVEEKKRTGLSDIRAAVREHRERDKDYMAQIIRMGEDDVENEKLTDIEIVAYNFIKDNFNFTPEGKILDPKTEYLNRNGLARFYLTFKGSTVSSQDFLGILFNNEPERGTGALILKPRVFSSQAIMEWNEKHAQKSAIIPLDE